MKYAVFLTGLFLAGQVWADIGSVTELSGTAIIKRGKETITVAKGTTVELNDTIETKNGKVKVVFKDNTNVAVTEHSALVIDDFVYDPKANSGKLNLKAAPGTVRYVSGNIAHNNPNAVNIKTPTAAIAVRGTDFIMSVAESGSSMVILMPTCEIEQGANLKGLTCGSGKIDVESGPNIVKLDRPFQATIVETAGSAPSLPMIVSLWNTPIGNNLQIAPPRTLAGLNVVLAARAAAEKTGDAKKEKRDGKEDKEDKDDREKERDHQMAKDGEERGRRGREDEAQSDEARNKRLIVTDTALMGDVGDTSKENPFVKKLWKDKSETQQVGWQYESLSATENNYTSVTLPMDTKVLVVVTQDRQTNAYNFNTQSSKAYGQIIVNQNYR